MPYLSGIYALPITQIMVTALKILDRRKLLLVHNGIIHKNHDNKEYFF